MGCGRGRIAHHFATPTGGQVSGYDIDPDQLETPEESLDLLERCGQAWTEAERAKIVDLS